MVTTSAVILAPLCGHRRLLDSMAVLAWPRPVEVGISHIVFASRQPEYWRSRAQKARLLADQLTDLLAKAATLRIADEYDQLAVRAADESRQMIRTPDSP